MGLCLKYCLPPSQEKRCKNRTVIDAVVAVQAGANGTAVYFCKVALFHAAENCLVETLTLTLIAVVP